MYWAGHELTRHGLCFPYAGMATYLAGHSVGCDGLDWAARCSVGMSWARLFVPGWSWLGFASLVYCGMGCSGLVFAVISKI
jgi:hypothetical protein